MSRISQWAQRATQLDDDARALRSVIAMVGAETIAQDSDALGARLEKRRRETTWHLESMLRVKEREIEAHREAGRKLTARVSVPDAHALRIAEDTLAMPDAIAGVMGAPSKEEAARRLRDS